jgi:hypothetical protein
LKWAPSPQRPKLSDTEAGTGAADGTGGIEGRRIAAGTGIETGIAAGGTGNASDDLVSDDLAAICLGDGDGDTLTADEGVLTAELAICATANAFGLISLQ